MFSAIVAIILIMTSVVLTSTLITTEERTSRQIYGMLNSYQLADAASLARADALQTFNYNFREKLEDYLTFTSVEMRDEPGFALFAIRTPGQTFTWDETVDNFEKTILLIDQNEGQKFDAALRFVSEKTIRGFKEETYGRYRVTLADSTQIYKAEEALYKGMQAAISRDGAEDADFLEVVDCKEGENDCPTGSFYFNISIDKLTDKEYEDLPRIVVKDLVTQEEIKMAILPKTKLRVYIPLRFFKALHEARKTVDSLSAVHNEIAAYRLGFCYPTCVPNKSPKDSSPVTWAKSCKNSEDGSEADLTPEKLGVSKYYAGGPNTGAAGIKTYAADAICSKAINQFDAFTTVDSSHTFTVFDTKLKGGEDQRRLDYDQCGLNLLVVATGAIPSYNVTGVTTGTGKLRCGQVATVYTDIAYKDVNPAYLVRGTYVAGESNIYKIRIEDLSYPKLLTDDQAIAAGLGGPCNSGVNECKP
jgi:hypothetical protein